MCRWFTSLCVVFVIVFISILFINIEEIVKENDELQLKRNNSAIKHLIEKSTLKQIVLWSHKYKTITWGVGFGQKVFKNCPETRCQTVRKSDTVHKNLSQYDAFLFHGYMRDFSTYTPLPKKRYPHQVYIFVSSEAPRGAHQVRFYKDFRHNFFNYTSEFFFCYNLKSYFTKL